MSLNTILFVAVFIGTALALEAISTRECIKKKQAALKQQRYARGF